MKYLISVGLNKINPNYYGTDGLLRGCVNDVYDVRDFIKPDDHTLLINEEAIVGNFISIIQEIAKIAKAGDTVFINYSGHGTQVVSNKELDGYDEGFCFYDRILLDKEFNNLLSLFQENVKIISFIDACHSGGLSRLPNPSDKWKPKTLLLPYGTKNTIKIKPVKAHYLGLLACLEKQVAMDGVSNGLFTETMLSNYRNTDPITWLKESSKKVEVQTFTYRTLGKKLTWKNEKDFVI